MSALGKLTNSIFSATNENNIQLAAINFDFTLLKFEAPKEFGPLGSALSRRRRQDAEEGQPHRTARRLGALFEDLIPDSPRLIESFGTRVSQVVQTPGISPSGSGIDGPFEPYVGADGTTLWAAATSGVASIGVYLLSCLLARAWDAKQATAIWVELIKQRKQEIEQAYAENKIVAAATLFAARQEISRDDLARWDNSARSWLRSADRAKQFEFAQLNLIQRNLALPVPANTSTYASVLSTWQQTMLGLEALLCGTPIMISNGSLLLAFSSWHLFPDLILLGNKTTHVKFRDQLFPPGGTGTINSEEASAPNLEGGLKWSLTLSHLKYYGDPVVARSNRDFTRVTFRQFKLVLLGSLCREWKASPREFEVIAQWLLDIWSILGELDSDARSRFQWLKHLVDAAQDLLHCGGLVKQTTMQLVQYGHRRAKSFLVDRSEVLIPYFGICSPGTLAALSQHNDRDCAIAYLRQLAVELRFGPEDAVICYALGASQLTDPSMVQHWEIATAVAHTVKSRKRDVDGHFLSSEQRHCRMFVKRLHGEGFSNEPINLESLMSKCIEQGENCSVITTSRPICQKKIDISIEAPNFAVFDPSAATGRNSLDECSGPWTKYVLVYGDWRLGLYVKESGETQRYTELHDRAVSAAWGLLSPAGGTQEFGKAKIDPCMLADYLSLIAVEDPPKLDDQWSWAREDSVYKRRAPGMSMSPVALIQCTAANFLPAALPHLARANAFSCIARFETGLIDLDPGDIGTALALCSEDSIFVAAVVLSDPFDPPASHDIRHILGNIGHPGLTLLVAPQEPKIRKPSDAFNVVAHAPYDFQRENNFTGTSLHLSFTDWKFPLNPGDERTIDQEVMVVESVISVLDRGRWVADLDIMCIDFKQLPRIATVCDKHERNTHDSNYDYFSIDSWDELLDVPEGVGIFRAHGNWAARLAAVSILSQQGQAHSIGVFGCQPVCFKCFEEEREEGVRFLANHESPLPSFCID
ncbi:hypothetical protein CFD26_105475 [Aspergillus turcosus]|uniref:Uncharacterized protein n=1 Tax=Aspergillus turcosus TaxID=1245748 RepID=A0A421D3V6_9EURO|nr:hypothetical protein CFD26_105475 [Aspergillus turcosus]